MRRYPIQGGFTLVEIAIVLLIVGLLTSSLLEPLAIAQQRKQFDRTRSELQQMKDSLHAHLISHGFLPCPIDITLGNSTSDNRGEASAVNCQTGHGGVPAVALGLSGAIDSHGALLDAWNRPYQYVVSQSNHGSKGNQQWSDWTIPGEASNVGLQHLASDLTLCTKAASKTCIRKHVRADNLVFIVLSLGQDVSKDGAQVENQDGDKTFVINAFSQRADHVFDDQLVWSSSQDALYWLLRAGWLP